MTQGSVTTTTTYTYEGLTLLSLDAESEEGTAASSWRIDYLTDAAGRPYGGVYTSSEASSVAFGIVTTDRGDIRELTDSAGVPFARYDHDAYGDPTRTLTAATAALDAATAAAIAERSVLRYAGYAYDAHSGLYYLSQRYCDPATCQFITKDPAKADGEESAYQYCGGDPVGKVDPSGEWRREFQPALFKDNTAYFLRVMRTNAAHARWQLLRLVAKFGVSRGSNTWAGWLWASVASGGQWDFKASWCKDNRNERVFGSMGRTISLDDLGNIHFGYVMQGVGVRGWLPAAGATAKGMWDARRKGNNLLGQWRHERVNSHYIQWGQRLYNRYGASRPARNHYYRGVENRGWA